MERLNGFEGNFARATAILKLGNKVNDHWRLGQHKVYRFFIFGADGRIQEVIQLRRRVPVIYFGDGRIIRQSKRILARRVLVEDGFYYPDEYQQRFFEFHEHYFQEAKHDQKLSAAAG